MTVRRSGSLEKGTAILEPDVDLIVVVNETVNMENGSENALYKEILYDFENVLLDEPEVFSARSFPGVNAVKVVLKSGLQCDVLPAFNKNSDDILREIGRTSHPTKKWRPYSNTLMQKQIAFIKSFQDVGHVIPLIELAKLWVKSLHIKETGKILGGMTMAELVAVAAYEECKHLSIVRSFLHFLEMMIHIDELKIAFEKLRNSERWALVHRDRLDGFDDSLVPRVIGNMEMMHRRFFIIDPANPFNDLFESMPHKHTTMTNLKHYARVTRTRVFDMLNGSYIFSDGSINFSKVFKPQIHNLETMFPEDTPTRIYIRYSFRGYKYPYSKITENTPGILRNNKRLLVNALRMDLVALVKIITIRIEEDGGFDSDYSDGSSGDAFRPEVRATKVVKTRVKRMVKQRLRSAYLVAGNGMRLHQEMDVTIDIPYQIGDYHYDVKLSMSWN